MRFTSDLEGYEFVQQHVSTTTLSSCLCPRPGPHLLSDLPWRRQFSKVGLYLRKLKQMRANMTLLSHRGQQLKNRTAKLQAVKAEQVPNPTRTPTTTRFEPEPQL